MESNNCSRCLLSTNVPGVEIDGDGVCNVCKNYDQYMLTWNEETSRNYFEQTLSKIKRKNTLYDVLVPLSGGKDSTYVLHQCKKVYGLKCLAMTYDNGFLSDHARKNISTACKILGVDHFYFGLNRDYTMSMYRHIFLHTGFFCPVCLLGMGVAIKRVQQAFDIPLCISGTSKNTEEHVHPAYFVEGDPSFFENVLKKNPYSGPVNYFLKQSGIFRSPIMIKMPEYVKWDYRNIFKTIKSELGWTAHEEDAEHSDCIVDNIVHYFRYQKYPALIPEMLRFSKLVTCGQMSRSEAINRVRIKKENLTYPENMDYFLNSLNISKQKMESVINNSSMHLQYLKQNSRVIRRLGHIKEKLLG
jgi:hypothetical protein